uniref:Uncharacterized protein n=1 Tax=Neolamprologus brichardi TaxID=32507 RepID=A0A3Q4MH64_NEOBR
MLQVCLPAGTLQLPCWQHIFETPQTQNPLSYLDSSTPAFTNSIGHSSTRRVNHGHEANKAQVLSGEVHIISIKSKAFWELVIRQVTVAET